MLKANRRSEDFALQSFVSPSFKQSQTCVLDSVESSRFTQPFVDFIMEEEKEEEDHEMIMATVCTIEKMI